MSKNFSRALLVPIISLLPFTQGVADTKPSPHHFENPPQLENPSVRNLVIQGKMMSPNTIQISAADIPTADQANQIRVITLTDVHGKKQRFILLPPDRTKWVRELEKYKGSIKEFNFYSVVDDKGDQTNLLASKRVMEAPANQLTVIFPSRQDAHKFFTEARQQSLAEEGFVITAESQAQITEEEQANEINQINQINNSIKEIQISARDEQKSKTVEPIGLFPTLSLIIIKTSIALPLHSAPID